VAYAFSDEINIMKQKSSILDDLERVG